MPKIIDPEERRRAIVRAACDVIVKDGLPALSLASVGAAAGLAVGSVRHYVGGHDDLHRLTLLMVGEQRLERLTTAAQPVLYPSDESVATKRRRVLEWLEQLLPLNDERLREATVWVALREAARTDQQLGELMADEEGRRLDLVRRVLGRVRPNWSYATRMIEARRLSALLRGLTVERVYAPQQVTAATLRQVLEQHLRQLRTG
jgi:AcrR family transcriptional regulator